MKNKIYLSIIAIIGVLAIGGVIGAYTGQNNGTVIESQTVQGNYVAESQDMDLGGAAGPDHYNHNRFVSNFSMGGQYYATSSAAATFTLTTAEFATDREDSYISWLPNVKQTLTTMASSSAPLVDLNVGEAYSMYFYNASTTAEATITFAAGTGVDLQEDEGETVVINGLEISKLTFLKKADTDVILWVQAGQVGD